MHNVFLVKLFQLVRTSTGMPELHAPLKNERRHRPNTITNVKMYMTLDSYLPNQVYWLFYDSRPI